MSPARNAQVRRFSLLWSASVLWKVVALGVFLYLAVRVAGGGL